MWQVLLTAAVAGTGFAAKRFLNPNADPSIAYEQSEAECIQSTAKEEHSVDAPSEPQLLVSPTVESNDDDIISDVQCSNAGGESPIFMFSSSESRGRSRKGSRFGSKNVRKKPGGINGGITRSVDSFEGTGFEEFEKRCGSLGLGKSGRRSFVCLKKRRTSKTAAGKCESCSFKGCSSFSWGLGVGIMCLMSAGKAEISRLNMAMDETVKVVQELKTELHRQKSLRDMQDLNPGIEVKMHSDKIRDRNTHPVLQSRTENMNHTCCPGPHSLGEGEIANVVLTEDQQQEVLEMDCLEAELESELQKLPGCSKEVSGPESSTSDDCETDALTEGFQKLDGQSCSSYHFNGVLPPELEQKLSHLLIEQQESQIVELESELQRAHAEHQEKEAELRALKDCVRRLTEFSLSNASDEEGEAQMEEVKAAYGDYGDGTCETIKPVAGMKRAMDFESCNCYLK